MLLSFTFVARVVYFIQVRPLFTPSCSLLSTHYAGATSGARDSDVLDLRLFAPRNGSRGAALSGGQGGRAGDRDVERGVDGAASGHAPWGPAARQSGPSAVPQLGSCGSSGPGGFGRRGLTGREAGPSGAKPLPRALELAASKAAHFPAVDPSGPASAEACAAEQRGFERAAPHAIR